MASEIAEPVTTSYEADETAVPDVVIAPEVDDVPSEPIVSLQEWFSTRRVGQIEIAGAFVRLHTAGVGTAAQLDQAFEAFKQQPA